MSRHQTAPLAVTTGRALAPWEEDNFKGPGDSNCHCPSSHTENGGLIPISSGLLEDQTINLPLRPAPYNVDFMKAENWSVIGTAIALGLWHLINICSVNECSNDVSFYSPPHCEEACSIVVWNVLCAPDAQGSVQGFVGFLYSLLRTATHIQQLVAISHPFPHSHPPRGTAEAQRPPTLQIRV